MSAFQRTAFAQKARTYDHPAIPFTTSVAKMGENSEPAVNGARPQKRLLLNAFDMNGIGHIR